MPSSLLASSALRLAPPLLPILPPLIKLGQLVAPFLAKIAAKGALGKYILASKTKILIGSKWTAKALPLARVYSIKRKADGKSQDEYHFWIFDKSIAAVSILTATLTTLIVLGSLERNPFNERWRLLHLSIGEERELGEAAAKAILDDCFSNGAHAVLPSEHPLSREIVRIVDALNNELPQLLEDYFKSSGVSHHAWEEGKNLIPQWKVHVLLSDTCNATCLPSGDVFIYAGCIARCASRDRLAAIIAHEMAHVISRHGAEQISAAAIMDVPLGYFSSILTLSMTAFGIFRYIFMWHRPPTSWIVDLPYSRHCEHEADVLGMELMSRAGFDPRAAIGSQAVLALAMSETTPSWARTHPPSEDRASVLRDNLPHCMQFYYANAFKEVMFDAALAVDERSFGNRLKAMVFRQRTTNERRLQDTIEYWSRILREETVREYLNGELSEENSSVQKNISRLQKTLSVE
ncbi:hypothetical protein FOL47_011064 [Perkinsus chesapeaki]|uniref:Peptidase M48 domain-containing protein n=1 Tax=Perkinsus chesapeaki TaxID=330153 RepID=A0A7J6MNC0_PERCH|nr:hypothetical protein FOL47_011064 [Perkinsus chesapeaki]